MMVMPKVKEGRDVWPNKGFLQQLIDWEDECNRFSHSHCTVSLTHKCL